MAQGSRVHFQRSVASHLALVIAANAGEARAGPPIVRSSSIVRYFTRGWANGELSDEASDQAREAYLARISEITPRLPSAMLRLLDEVSLHDGVIDEVVWNPSLRRLRLELVGTDEHRRPVQVQLTYRGAMLGGARLASLRRAALSRETELLFDEVDIDEDAVLTHRLLFAPCEELTIDFEALDLVVTPRTDRRVNLGTPFIEEGPEDGLGEA